jgi:sugar phosphate isomerase/epimerase
MVQFGSGYNMPMDRDFDDHDHGDHNHDHGFAADPDATSTKDVGIGMGDLGISMGLGPIPNVHAINAKLRPGSKKVELVFTGFGKGSGQGQTPGQYGFKQRQALVELGKANKVDFTTHSTVGVMGLAGMDRSGNFSRESQDASLQEVKRAIEFAADVGKGGPIVVHTGEFQRSTSPKLSGNFELYSGESEEQMFTVIDTRTGGVIAKERKNRNVVRPVWLKADKDMLDKGIKKGDYIDYFDKKVTDLANRVPVYNKKTGEFETEKMIWEDVEDEAKRLTADARRTWEDWKARGGDSDDKEFKKSFWTRFGTKEIEDASDIRVTPEEAWVIQGFQTSMANAVGWAKYQSKDFEELRETISRLKKELPGAKLSYENALKTGNPDALNKLKKVLPSRLESLGIKPEVKFEHELIEDQILQMKRQLEQSQQSASSQMAQAENSAEQIRNIQDGDTYAIKEAAKAYAKAGIFAMRQSDRLEEKGHLKKPLAIALENLFPGSYGAHPEELMELVSHSRKTMVQELTKTKEEGGGYGYSQEKAAKIAKAHITTTLDTGHLNMWRKHWKTDPEKTIKENDEDYDKWMIKMVEKMAKKDMIGHVHIDDNYGYHDDHLAPGEGNTPIKKMLEVMKKNGYKGEMIVEPGADYYTDQNGFNSVEKTWRHLGIQMGKTGRNWAQISNYWAGQNAPPYFMFGNMAPNPEEWRLWSGVPLE